MTQKKMAQTAAIRVSVLEGCYNHLQAVGVPLPLCMHMQELGLFLNTAQWTAKQSIGGFSVSFFWPALSVSPYHSAAPKPRKRRRKKKNVKLTGTKPNESPSGEGGAILSASATTVVPPVADVHPVASDPSSSEDGDSFSPSTEVGTTMTANSTTDVSAATPVADVHPEASDLSSTEDNESSAESLDLKSCESVVLDIRDVPGVSFVKDGVTDWTPVVSRRKKDRLTKRNRSLCSPASSSSGCDLDLSECEAEYLMRLGSPGIAARHTGGSRLWTPIAARTRYKLRTTPRKKKNIKPH